CFISCTYLALATSGSLDTGLAIVMDNPVNLRGSLEALPEEGSRAPERSPSSVDQIRASRARAVGAQPQRTGSIRGAGAWVARGERRMFIHRSRTGGRAIGGRFDCQVGRSVQPGRPGSGGTAGRWPSTYPVWATGARPDSCGVSTSAGSRARRDGDL